MALGKTGNRRTERSKRKIMYTKKADRKSWSEEVVAREHLEDLEKENVVVSGVLKFFNRTDPYAPCLLLDVDIDGRFVDHTWVRFKVSDRKKLKLCPKNGRVYFKATVREYCKREDRHLRKKYGLTDLDLITV